MNRSMLLTLVALSLLFAHAAMAADSMPWSAGPIPIRFKLDKPGFVTLVIEDQDGKRVRNLLAEEKFAAGEHTVYWDGADGADVHLHKTRATLVNPGQYVVRGLVRDELKLIYEFPVYNPGNPPWRARDPKTGLEFGRWLSDHNQPSGALFLPNGSPAGKDPQLMFCAGGAEWGDGFMWLDLDGRKLHGQRWAGGVFAGAERLARDAGSDGVPGVYAYSIKGKRQKNKKNPDAVPQVGVQIMAFTEKKDAGEGQAPFEDLRVLGQDRPLQGKHEVAPGASPVSGIAAWNGLVVVSAVCDDQLLLIDAKKNSDTTETTSKKGKEGGSLGEEIGTVELVQPRGLVFNAKGDLFALSGAKLLLFPDAGKALRAKQLPQPRVLVERGLDEPTDVTLDKDGNLYVSDRGTHQVKVFSPEGKPLRTLGKPGGVQLGNYDEQRMFNPAQVAVTDGGEVWVAEDQFTPRRISRWKVDGSFVRAYYGPPGYGGGGRITPDGKSVIYCHGDPWHAQATLRFDLDWQAGTGTIAEVRHWIDVPGEHILRLPGTTGPQHEFEYQGRRYFHNASYLQGGEQCLSFWKLENGRYVPVAALGRPNDWKKTLLSDEFRGKLPKGVDPNRGWGGGQAFAWADLNGDGAVQADEVRWYEPKLRDEGPGPFVVQERSFVLLSTKGRRYEPVAFSAKGAPIYDPNQYTVFRKEESREDRDGFHSLGGMLQLAADGSVLQFGSPIICWRTGQPLWTYPNEWLGVHASHVSPKPRWGGDINSGMKNPGPLFTPRGGEAGQMWALSSNWGCVHLGTIDGLYVGTVMRDARTAEYWPASVKRGDNVIDYTNGQESFGVSLQQLDDGRIILSVGGEMIGLCRLEGLDSVRRLPRQTIAVGPAELQAALKMQADLRAEQKAVQDSIKVRIDEKSRPATAKLDDWKDAEWATIETARIAVGMGTKPMEMKAAMRVCGDRLHVAWLLRNGANFLDNSVETPASLFKSGAALDLMLGAAGAEAGRKTPVVGDQRILIARTPGQKGTLTAMLYRQKSSTPGNKQTFSSPWRSIEFDDVREITKSIEFKESQPIPAQPTEQRLYEVSIPLDLLGLKVKEGTSIRGDIGYLRGTPGQTSERVYWHNKVTGLIADVPGEALLDPAHWGTLEFTKGT